MSESELFNWYTEGVDELKPGDQDVLQEVLEVFDPETDLSVKSDSNEGDEQ